MAALLVSLAVMSILMAVAMPAWRQAVQREREAELVFRGEQYARAIGLFQRKFAGAFPPSIDVLVQQKFLRKKYKDPMVPDGQFQVLYQTSALQQPGQPGRSFGPGGTISPGSSEDAAPGTGFGTPGAQIGRTPGAQPGATPGAQVGISSSQLGGPGTAFGTAGARGGVTGVVSKSTKKSFRLYKGRGRYNEWQFVYTEVATRVGPGSMGPGGQQGPGGMRGPGGRPGTGPGTGSGFPRPGGMGPGGMSSPGRPPFGTPPGGATRPLSPGTPPQP